MAEENGRDMHRVYTIVPRENAKDFWLNIGAAWPHKDGKGWNVQLQALPLDSKLVIRAVDEDGGPQSQD